MTDFAKLRTAMVDCQIRPSDVTKFPIIEAMLSVRREVFVPTARRDVAYCGEHIPLNAHRVVLDPRVLAKMLDALAVGPKDMVLLLGCGLGYSSAVLARMVEAVVAVEDDAELAAEAEANLAAESVDNAVVFNGALTEGAPKHGPYDAMVFGGAVEQIPETLLAQLKERGKLVALFADGAVGQCRVGVKAGGRIAWHTAFDAVAPVLPGFERRAAFTL